MADAVDKLMRLLADHDRRLQAVERGSQLGHSSIRVNGQDVSVADSVRASILADEKAAEAITRATDALAKADGVVNTYFTDDGTAPDDPAISQGDFWYRRDTRESYQWDGAAWQPLTSADIKAALEAASAAQSAVDGKISTYYSTTTPTNPGVGDIWYQPPTNTPKRWNGTAWQSIRDGRIQDALDAASDAKEAALTAQQSADGRTKVVYSSHDPDLDGVNQGDTWFKTDAGGVVTGQWQWSGTSWQQVTPQSATIASLDAGRITTGTLAAGVSITAGVPGGDRTVLSSDGLFAYIGGSLRFRLDSTTASMTTDIISSSGALSGGRSYLRLGTSAFGDNVDNLTFFQPGYNAAVLRNTLNTGQGALEIALQTSSSGGKSYYFDANSLSTDGTFSIQNRTYGTSMTITNVTSIGGSYGTLTAGGYYDQWYNTYGISLNIGYNGSGIQVTYPPNGAYGTAFVRNTYYGGGALKFTSDNALQARDYNDNGYAYFRGIIQDQSNPDLKENITEVNVDALASIAGMKFYAYDWKREPVIPFVQPPRDSSTGLLLSEVPHSVQQTEDGYSTGSLLGLTIAALNQLRIKVEALEATR